MSKGSFIKENKSKLTLHEEQKRAIESRGKSLLVSASAGSGKTYVMIERIVSFLTKDKLNITDILAVTFTNAAANEMRIKIEKRLNEELKREGLSPALKKHLARQIEDLPMANISTFHMFCKSIIDRYFYLLDIDASSRICSEQFAQSLADKAAGQVIENNLQSADEEFFCLLEAFSGKRSFGALKDAILTLYNFLCDRADADEFKERCAQSHRQDLNSNPGAAVLNDKMALFCAAYSERIENVKMQALQAGAAGYAEFCSSILGQLKTIKHTSRFSENRKALGEIKFDSLRKKAGEHEEIFEALKAAKDDLTYDLGALKTAVFCGIDESEIKNALGNSFSYLKKLLILTEEFKEAYSALKRENKALDFSDLERGALEVLSRPEVTEEVGMRYREVFVDEYQDTNDVQEAILKKISGKNNLFLVGDIKQSIYGFRNANPQIFSDKYKEYKTDGQACEVVDLNRNFRSDNRILQFVNFLFAGLMTQSSANVDYKNTAQFSPGNEFVSDGMPAVEIDVIKSYSADEEDETKRQAEKLYSVKDAGRNINEMILSAKAEARLIAARIAEMVNVKTVYDSKTEDMRTVNYGDIVILMRSQKEYARVLINELAVLGVPVSTNFKRNLLDCYEVRVLHSFLLLLDNELNDFALAAVLLSPIINLNENDLAQIRLKYKEREFFRAAKEYRERENDQISAALKKLNNLINFFRIKAGSASLYNLVSLVLSKTNFLSLVTALPDGLARAKNVEAYLHVLQTDDEFTDLNTYINTVKDSGGALAAESSNGKSVSVVRVETMHHSKGLEFPVVFLAGLGGKFSAESRKGDLLLNSFLGAGLYSYNLSSRTKRETVVREAIKELVRQREFAEELRLLYVACTRAKNHLFLVGAVNPTALVTHPDDYRFKRLNNFMQIILSRLTAAQTESLLQGIRTLCVNKGKPCEFNLNLHSLGGFEVPKEIKNSTLLFNLTEEDSSLKAALEDYCRFEYPDSQALKIAFKTTVTKLQEEEGENVSLNVNALNAFNINEQQFEQARAADKGSAYHKAMEVIDFNLKTQKEITEHLKAVLKPDEFKLIDCAKIFKAVAALQALGADLPDAKILREQNFYMLEEHKNVVPGSEVKDKILVQGAMDLIIQNGTQTILIDFKTTRANNGQELIERYKIQLEAYKIALESALNCTLTKKYLYSFYLDKLILIDN